MFLFLLSCMFYDSLDYAVGWHVAQLIEHLPSIYENLGLIPSTTESRV